MSPILTLLMNYFQKYLLFQACLQNLTKLLTWLEKWYF